MPPGEPTCRHRHLDEVLVVDQGWRCSAKPCYYDTPAESSHRGGRRSRGTRTTTQVARSAHAAGHEARSERRLAKPAAARSTARASSLGGSRPSPATPHTRVHVASPP